MAILVSTAIEKARTIMKEITPAMGLEIMQEVHNELLNEHPLFMTTEDITLVAGTDEYDLNEQTIQLWHAEYLKSATDRKPLRMFDVPARDIENPNWRALGRNRPAMLAVWRNDTNNVVLLSPPPNESTSSGYPLVRLYVSRLSTLTAVSSLPTNLINDDVYVYGVCARYSARRVPEKYEFYRARFLEAVGRQVKSQMINLKAPPRKVYEGMPMVGRI